MVPVSLRPGVGDDLWTVDASVHDHRGTRAVEESELEFAAMLAQMGALLLPAETVEEALRLVTALAAESVPGSIGAGVSIMDERGKRSTAASDPRVEQADAWQYEMDAGPCVAAWRDRATVRIDDVASEARWPQWSAAVVPLGIASVLSSPLIAGQDSIGAIKVYAAQPGAFDTRAARLLELFAQQAAILLANTRSLAQARQLSEHLRQALQSRDLIGQAKGILVAQGARDDDAAFAMLVSASQRSNVKLHEVARQLVASFTRAQAQRGGSSGPSPAP